MDFKSVIMPSRIEVEEETHTDRYGKFVVEPLERGYGITLGNSLRRVLLSSIRGTALRHVKIAGVLQEVSYLPGVVEDVTDIVLNLSNIVFKLHRSEPVTLSLSISGPGEVTAADIRPNPDVEILNPEEHIATLEEDGVLEMEMLVDVGIGYLPSERNKIEDGDIYTIPLDSVFSPVKRVKYKVENTRVGDITDYDRLNLEIWTNGTIRPEEALSYAGRLLKDYMSLFIHFEEGPVPIYATEKEDRQEINPALFKAVDELELSVRSYNCLKAANIRTVAELVQKTENEILKYRNFGRKSLTEIKELLERMGLALGVTIDDPEILRKAEERLAKREAEML
ncbi:MAG: DNA-directed RNA polymerase subunit alpha [Candidatus Omnitrophica bacterium]|nr:DNA-directed RNA polymerase subunit alpha [bacterium]NUN95850.1 DNA-directed RNA polymerase subunit alpha [Candidatus Omnitrophota bacterium]